MSSEHLAVVLVALASLSCDSYRVEESTTEELRFDAVDTRRIEVRVDEGSVDVEPSRAEGVVEAIFRKRARASDRKGALALLETARAEGVQEGATLRVRARTGLSDTLSFGGTLRTDVTLRLPPDIELDVRTDDGNIALTDVSGVVSVETEDGRVRLSRIRGDVTVRTWDGSIAGSDLQGAFDVETGDGRVRLDGSFTALRAVTGDGSLRIECREPLALTQDWTIRTLDGSIELELARSLSARLEASSSDGRVVNDLSRFEGITGERRSRGTLGKGGPLILVTTLDGRITLKDY